MSLTPLIRNATIDDAFAMARIESECWPAEIVTTKPQIESRIATYTAGQWVAVIRDEIVGTIFAQRITEEYFGKTAAQYDALTDNGSFVDSHDDQGEIYQMVGVSVLPSAKGRGLGRALVEKQIDFARSITAVKRIIGFTRPVKYHEHSGFDIREYVDLRREDGGRVDPVLSFHLDNGATFKGAFEGYRCEDKESLGYGILIEYSVHE